MIADGAVAVPLTTEEVDSMIRWIVAEVRAEQAFPWYLARGPSRLIARCPPCPN